MRRIRPLTTLAALTGLTAAAVLLGFPSAAGAQEPTEFAGAATTTVERELGFHPEFGVGEGMKLRVGGSIRARPEHYLWTADDSLVLFHSHSHTSAAAGEILNEDRSQLETRLRLFGELEISPHLTARLELQHARIWSDERDAHDNADKLDLYQGYLDFTSPSNRDWSLRLGRFSVPNFGDERIMSPNDWDTLGHALDGASATWAPEGLALTLLATNTGRRDPVRSAYDDDDDYWFGGAALELRQLEWLDLDCYAFGRYFDRSFVSEQARETDRGRRLDVTLGTFAAFQLGPLRLVGELYGQVGVQGADDVRAWASAERIELKAWSGNSAPTLFFEHAFASGDKRSTDGVIGTFDPLFANYHDHHGPFDAVGYRNTNELAIGFTQSLGWFGKQLEPITFTFVARGSFLASQNDAWYDAKGNVVLRDPTGDTASSRTLEGELSGWFTLDLLDGALQVTAGLAHWCPNNLATDLNWHEHSYRWWISSEVRF